MGLARPSVNFKVSTCHRRFTRAVVCGDGMGRGGRQPIPTVPRIPVLSRTALSCDTRYRVNSSSASSELFHVARAANCRRIGIGGGALFVPYVKLGCLCLRLRGMSRTGQLGLCFSVKSDKRSGDIYGRLTVRHCSSSDGR